MKLFFKYIISILTVAVIAVSLWLYYPIYQIQQMKEEAVPSSAQAALSYVEYFSELDQDQLTHLAIGDSIITGIGSEEEESFVSYFSRQLQKQTGKSVELQNEGIPGINSTDLNALVQKGEFDEQIKQADLITINVGGNDILEALYEGDYQNVIQNFDLMQSTFTQNLNALEALYKGDYQNIIQNFDSMQSMFTQNLDAMSKTIKQANPDATIVFLEMYNPLKQDHEYYSLADQLLPKWNVKIYEIAHQLNHTIVLETTKVINSHHLQYLSVDGVHPNSLGYQALSKQMLEQLKKKPFIKSA